MYKTLSHLVGTIGIGKRLSADISVKRYIYYGNINCAPYHVIKKKSFDDICHTWRMNINKSIKAPNMDKAVKRLVSIYSFGGNEFV